MGVIAGGLASSEISRSDPRRAKHDNQMLLRARSPVLGKCGGSVWIAGFPEVTPGIGASDKKAMNALMSGREPFREGKRYRDNAAL